MPPQDAIARTSGRRARDFNARSIEVKGDLKK